MAAEGKAILYFTAVIFFFFYFVSIDEISAMGSQPNLASRSEMVSINKCHLEIFGALSPNLGRKTSTFEPLFRDFSTRHRI